MDSPNVPQSTLRVLASLLVLLFDFAREHSAVAVERIKPLVEPPDDLRVTSRIGALYSGIVLLDRGEIIAGVIVQTGHGIPSPAAFVTPSPTRSPISGITDRYAQSRDESRLPGWADDPRPDLDEDAPWRRR
jgi:hypothetical protein